jgi:hypothetical protein
VSFPISQRYSSESIRSSSGVVDASSALLLLNSGSHGFCSAFIPLLFFEYLTPTAYCLLTLDGLHDTIWSFASIYFLIVWSYIFDE